MRRVLAALLGLIAVVGLVFTTVGVWANETVFDSAEFRAAASETYSNPDVQTGIAEFITAQTLSLVDVEGLISGAVPDRLGSMAPVIAGGLEAKLNSVVGELLTTEAAARGVDLAVDQAHSGLVRVLSGGNLIGGVSTRDSEVRLNLLPLISRALISVQNLGVLGRVNVPVHGRNGDPAQQIAELSQALRVDLPDDFGQLVVYRGELVEHAASGVAFAQRTVILAQRSIWLAGALTLIAAVGSLALARSRSRAVLYLSLGAGVASVLARSSVSVVIDQASHLVADPRAKVAVVSVLGSLSGGLVELLGLLVVIAGAMSLVSLMLQGFALRPVAVTAGAVTMVLVVLTAGVGPAALVVGIALALLVSLAVSRLSGAAIPGRT